MPASSDTVRLDSLRQYMVARGETGQKIEMVKVLVQVPLARMLKENETCTYSELYKTGCAQAQWLVPT